jgi:ribosomal-protein-alanine N-acetyltransferase
MTTATQPLVTFIRWGIQRDVPQLLRIERASFPAPWAEDDFIAVLRKRNCILMVAERNERILGYLVYRLSADGLTVLNLAVDPAVRRQRVGWQLVLKLAAKLGSHRRDWIDAVTSERNLPAHLFFRACAFRAVEVLPGEYGDDDGYRFRFDR